MRGLDGYINSAFSSSQTTLASKFWPRRKENSEEGGSRAHQRPDPDTDIDMDSFLSDLERGSENSLYLCYSGGMNSAREHPDSARDRPESARHCQDKDDRENVAGDLADFPDRAVDATDGADLGVKGDRPWASAEARRGSDQPFHNRPQSGRYSASDAASASFKERMNQLTKERQASQDMKRESDPRRHSNELIILDRINQRTPSQSVPRLEGLDSPTASSHAGRGQPGHTVGRGADSKCANQSKEGVKSILKRSENSSDLENAGLSGNESARESFRYIDSSRESDNQTEDTERSSSHQFRREINIDYTKPAQSQAKEDVRSLDSLTLSLRSSGRGSFRSTGGSSGGHGLRRILSPRSQPPPVIPEEAELEAASSMPPIDTKTVDRYGQAREFNRQITLASPHRTNEGSLLYPHGSVARPTSLPVRQQSCDPRRSAPEAREIHRPEPRLSNLFGLLDLRKMESLLDGGVGGHEGYRDGSSHASRRYRKDEEVRGRPCDDVDLAPEESGPWLSITELSCLLGLTGLVLLVVAMASPCWLVSWEATNSPFVRLGPWEACFRRFRFPNFQHDKVFNGCGAMWGTTYELVREWLLPPWFIAIQILLIFSQILSILSRSISISILLRQPIEVILRFGKQICFVVTCLDLLTGTLLLICTLVFAGCCWSRDWLLYPNYNYLSWGWAAGLLAGFAHLAGAALFMQEYRRESARYKANQQLLEQLRPASILSPEDQGIYII